MTAFEFNYKVTGNDRKRLVSAIGEILEVPPKYLGAPTFAYGVDYITIDKNGIVSFDDCADSDGGCLGMQRLYANEELQVWAERHKGEIARVFGLRAFFALGQDNTIKYTDAWFRDMLILEQAVMEKPTYREAAFFNHLLITKAREENR